MFDVTPEELEKISRQADEAMVKLGEAMRGLRDVTGEATAADGKIKATVEADGLVRDLRLDPRVLRTMGIDELSEAIVEALRAAQMSVREQMEEQVRAVGVDHAAPLSMDPAEARARLDSLQADFIAALQSR
ncbi:YbaB/EbfC family nucleoid-associated protein [Nonomuraea guangzhouensis]|uniref:YbaB/EbfC family nucleoid-associated protein n=1 Tax=Nonomuraea guangzhouensis TaxID=1291555 RepID=A0ABW4G0S6_9ACTN|nr:YbaB/EbfC family nucleoid-associated protein [Nonomuraea guangzhouensis]